MNWEENLIKFCQEYNIPLEYIVDILSDPKVVPMIRGKAFEFSVVNHLSQILNPEKWKVDKPVINSQLGNHDTDVRVIHIATNKVITVECKLTKNGSYRRLANPLYPENYTNRITVKCMRSRTLGNEMVDKLAPKLGISKTSLAIHNDQYLPDNFDFVVTSLGNAFYQTNQETKIFEWKPTLPGLKFLESINNTNMNLKDFAFHQMYIARSTDLAVNSHTQVKCTRKKCDNSTNCGFIPNYPILEFTDGNKTPLARWFPIENTEELFNQFIV